MFSYFKDPIKTFHTPFNLFALLWVFLLTLSSKILGVELGFYDQSEMTLINYYSSPPHFQEAQLNEPNPIMLAIDRSYDRLVRVLINLGTDVNIRNRDGITPLLWAVNKNNNHITRILLDYEASPNLADNKGWTPLMLAAKNNNLYLTRLLVESGANVNATNFEGSSALLWASHSASVVLVDYLFSEGANLNHRNLKNQTVAHIAAQFGKEEVLRFLLLKDPSLAQSMDAEGKTPLLKAVETSRYNIVDILAPYEFRTNPDNPLVQAIALAERQGDKQMVDYLKAFFPEKADLRTSEELVNKNELETNSFALEDKEEVVTFRSLASIPKDIRLRILTFLGILDPSCVYSVDAKKISTLKGELWTGTITYNSNNQVVSQSFDLRISCEEKSSEPY